MAKSRCSRRELLKRWSEIQEEQEEDDTSPSKQRRILQLKEEWFSDSFDFLVNLPKENHIWCSCQDLMGPLLETFHDYFHDNSHDSPLKIIWRRASQELGHCTQCVCQHHQAQELYTVVYESDTVGSLLSVLRCLDEERITEHLKNMNERIHDKEYNAEIHSAEVVSLMFEVLMFPIFFLDQSLVNEFQLFIEAIDESHEMALSSNQQYPGIYALLFLKSGRARAVGFRLAGSMGKLRRASDLDPLQALLKKYIGFLEVEVSSSTLDDAMRPRVRLERINIWHGIKTLLGFLEAEAFEDGILERYPTFLSIVLNHVSDDTAEFSCAVTCLRTSFELLGCKLWLRTTLSPSMMRNTLLGQCFHTRNEKSHKDIFDLFLPFLQSLEALQDGEYEKQRRHLIYFLLHQVTHSRNFSVLMQKHACKTALLIIHRGYKMNPPCPPFECAHMWGPSLINSLKDSSLHISLRQPAFDLINSIIVSDASALNSLKLKNCETTGTYVSSSNDFIDEEDEQLFADNSEGNNGSCWCEFDVQNKLTVCECKQWACVPMLWFEALINTDPSLLPISFSKAVFWALSHISLLELGPALESSLSFEEWLSIEAKEISSSFGWEVPNGSDDGGDGKVSRNSVEASSMATLLVKTLKRFAAHFLQNVERHEFHKQWMWESKMAESIVLLLVVPDDSIRQADRIILEHVSRTSGLTSGLQFLCSSAAALSSVFSGLRFALNQVLADSLLTNFHKLHHLFFILKKLLKEVVASDKRSTKEDLKGVAPLSEGGFLRHPFTEHIPAESPGSVIVIDTKSWEKFSCCLSVIILPLILKCLEEGKNLVNSKNCQMTCVRLLEALPVVYEKTYLPASNLSGSLLYMASSVYDFKWLLSLVEWGNSSLIVVVRHWKQCMFALLNCLKSSQGGKALYILGVIDSMLSHDNVPVGELKEKFLQLSISVSRKASLACEQKNSRANTLLSEPFPEKRSSASQSLVNDVLVDTGDKLPTRLIKAEDVIVLSEDELEEMSSSRLTCKGSSLSGSIPSKGSLKPFPSVKAISSRKSSSQSQIQDVFQNNSVSCKVESSQSSISSLIQGKTAELSATSVAIEVNSSVQRDKSTTQHVHHQSSSRSISSLESVKENLILKQLVHDDEDDPLELALEKSRRPRTVVTIQNISVPKRKVVHLHFPMNGKPGLLNKTESVVRRLKPPRLDDWYKPILELDYFAVVGSTPDTENGRKCSTNLKKVPLCFQSSSEYVEIFRPLVLEEFKAQLQSSHIDSSIEDMVCGSLFLHSVERIDDFLLVRGRPDDTESFSSKGCSDNDLVLLSKEPLQSASKNVHVLGKVERRERSDKSRTIILTIRFYLPNDSSRFNKARRLLIERSKWFLSRILSMTPQLREFQALSSLNDIPMLPVILNPVNESFQDPGSRKNQLDRLSLPMQKMLTSLYNESQLQAISIALGSSKSMRKFELSLIQGPPGTGKTRTIVAIISALLALPVVQKNRSNQMPFNDPVPTHNICSKPRAQLSTSAAISRAWQEAAFAKQLMKDAEKYVSKERPSGRRVLICAQSNAAVDELISRISEGLYGVDGKTYKPYLVRVGNSKTVHTSSLPFFIDTLVEQRLAEEISNKIDSKSELDAESSGSLRSKLEKVVENIRYYESKRSEMNEQETNTKISVNGVEVSDSAIGAKLNILYGQKKTICGELAVAQARERKLSDENRSLKYKIRKTILQEAEIVVATLSGSGGDLYGVCSESTYSNKFGNFSEQSLFDVVIIDEAAQALEPATLIPLQLLKSHGTKCIMVGDPKQLPATVLSNVASKFLFECSMFERLQKAGHPIIMLTEQYRMHPEICQFPSMHFYENKLLSGPKMSDRSTSFHENNFLGPYMFYDVCDGHEQHGKNSGSVSLFNEAEVDAAVEILKFLKKRYPFEFKSRKIGIVTPYRSQLSLLRSRCSNAFGPEVISDLEFNTVDGFQGREVDILVLSTVRASDSSSEPAKMNSSGIGFVADVRRMNVALTRAKFSLWVIGNARTLQMNIHWAALIQNSKERNLFISVRRPYSSIFLKAVSLSRGNISPKKAYLSSNRPKEGERNDSVGLAIPKIKVNAVEGKRRKSIFLDTNSDKKLSGCNGDENSSFSIGGLPEKVHGCSRYSESRKPSKQNEGKKDQKKKQMFDSMDTMKEHIIHEGQEGRTKDNISFRKDSTSSNLKKKAVGTKISSANIKSDAASVVDYSTSRTSVEQIQETEKAGKSKPSNVQEHKDFIAARKRRREDVEALLPSAFISSKKRKEIAKSESRKKPFSGSGSASGDGFR